MLKGCLKKYYLKDGQQIKIYITTENSFINVFDRLITGNASKEIIVTHEPSELLVLNKKDLEKLYNEIPLTNEFIGKTLEQTLIH